MLTLRFIYFASTEDKLCIQTKQALTSCSCNDYALFAGDNYADSGFFYDVCFSVVTPFPSSALPEATVMLSDSILIPSSPICAECRSP